MDFRKIYPEELYRGGPSGHTVALLAAAYECDTEVPAGSYQRPDVFDGAVDSGNNAWATGLDPKSSWKHPKTSENQAKLC